MRQSAGASAPPLPLPSPLPRPLSNVSAVSAEVSQVETPQISPHGSQAKPHMLLLPLPLALRNNGNPMAAMATLWLLRLQLRHRFRLQWATKQLKSVCFVLGIAHKKVVARPSTRQQHGRVVLFKHSIPYPFPSSSPGCPAQYVELLIKAKDESNARPNELEKQSKKAGIKGIAKRVTKDNHNCGNCRRAKEGGGGEVVLWIEGSALKGHAKQCTRPKCE